MKRADRPALLPFALEGAHPEDPFRLELLLALTDQHLLIGQIALQPIHLPQPLLLVAQCFGPDFCLLVLLPERGDLLPDGLLLTCQHLCHLFWRIQRDQPVLNVI